MKFTTALSALLCGTAVLASPMTGAEKRHRNREARKMARRDGTVLKSGGKIASGKASGVKPDGSFVEYSENWAGAVITSTKVTSVTGTVVVEDVASGDGAAWVGIDGDSCETAILQTGFQWIDGAYSAWYEWYPADSCMYSISCYNCSTWSSLCFISARLLAKSDQSLTHPKQTTSTSTSPSATKSR